MQNHVAGASTQAAGQEGQKGLSGFPVATVAFYGPDNRRASKLTVGIVLGRESGGSGAEAMVRRAGDVREDVRVAAFPMPGPRWCSITSRAAGRRST